MAPILFVLQRIWHLDEKTVSKLFTISGPLNLEEKKDQMVKAVDYIKRFDPEFTWKRIELIEQKTVKDKEKRIMQLFKSTLDEAREEGHLKGQQEGIQKGRQEEKKKVALKLLQGGMDFKTIKETTELSEEAIKAIEKELGKKR